MLPVPQEHTVYQKPEKLPVLAKGVRRMFGALTVSAWGALLGHLLSSITWFTQAIWPRRWQEELATTPAVLPFDPAWLFVYVPAALALLGAIAVGRFLRQWWVMYRNLTFIRSVRILDPLGTWPLPCVMDLWIAFGAVSLYAFLAPGVMKPGGYAPMMEVLVILYWPVFLVLIFASTLKYRSP